MIAAGGHGPARDQGVVGDHLGANEAASDVAVNLARRNLCLGVARNRPRAALVLANREEREVAEQIVSRANDAIESRFSQAEIGQECRRIRGNSRLKLFLLFRSRF